MMAGSFRLPCWLALALFTPWASGQAPFDARWSDAFGLAFGCDATITAAVQTEEGDIYLGGHFRACGKVAASGLIRYEPESRLFVPVGSNGGEGVVGSVLSLAWHDGTLYVGGSFGAVNAGAPIPASNLARWNGATWEAVGDGAGQGVDGAVLAMLSQGTELVLAGEFTTANVGDPVSARRVARWTESGFLPFGSAMSNGADASVRAISGFGHELCIGGDFQEVSDASGALPAQRLACWSADTWQALGSAGGDGADATVRALAEHQGLLYVGGDFASVNTGSPVAANRIASWNGSAWSGVGSGAGNGVGGGANRVRSLMASEDGLYVGGNFTAVNAGEDIPAHHVARWSGDAWSALGDSGSSSLGAEVHSLAKVQEGVLALGSFAHTEFHLPNRRIFNHAAVWNGDDWFPIGDGQGAGLADTVPMFTSGIEAVLVDGTDVYVGGSFSSIGDVVASSIARFDRVTGRWHALTTPQFSAGAFDFVAALAMLDGQLYVGGRFSSVFDTETRTVNNLARWDGERWHSVGSNGGIGVDPSGFVSALAVHNGALYVGGDFSSVNTGSALPANNIARWDGSQWSALGAGSGNGLGGSVDALIVWQGDLYAGGRFLHANVGDPLLVNHLARWNGMAWSSVGTGVGSGVGGDVDPTPIIRRPVRSLAVWNEQLCVGGEFSEVNVGDAIPARNVACWDGDGWSVLGTSPEDGIPELLLAMAADASGLYVSGARSSVFQPVDGHEMRLARWNGQEWTHLGSEADWLVTELGLDDEGGLWSGGYFSRAGGKVSMRIGKYQTLGRIDVRLMGTQGGSVTSDPPGIACPGACSAEFPWDIDVILTAEPDQGAGFTAWSEAGCAGSPQCALRFESGLRVTATFGTPTFSIGGQVAGLLGQGLILQNGEGEQIQIDVDGPFEFATPQLDGTPFDVTVVMHPTQPVQFCRVMNGTGQVQGADIDDIEVACVVDHVFASGFE